MPTIKKSLNLLALCTNTAIKVSRRRSLKYTIAAFQDWEHMILGKRQRAWDKSVYESDQTDKSNKQYNRVRQLHYLHFPHHTGPCVRVQHTRRHCERRCRSNRKDSRLWGRGCWNLYKNKEGVCLILQRLDKIWMRIATESVFSKNAYEQTLFQQ